MKRLIYSKFGDSCYRKIRKITFDQNDNNDFDTCLKKFN